jgi:uncharacterized protein
VQALFNALIAGIPAEPGERSEEQQGLWLLAHLLDFHRREAKAPWWEFFRLRELTDEELFDERAAVAGLRFVRRLGITKKGIPTDRYSYPPQETEIRSGDELYLSDATGTTFGIVEGVDRAAHTLDIKKRGAQAEVHPSALFAHSVFRTGVLEAALFRIARVSA